MSTGNLVAKVDNLCIQMVPRKELARRARLWGVCLQLFQTILSTLVVYVLYIWRSSVSLLGLAAVLSCCYLRAYLSTAPIQFWVDMYFAWKARYQEPDFAFCSNVEGFWDEDFQRLAIRMVI